MNERFRALALLLSASTLAVACTAPGGDTPANPTTPEEALKALPQENRQAFELWKSQALKSCNAAEALMGGSTQDTSTPKYIDVGTVVARLGNTAMITQGSSRFAILGNPEEPTGTHDSEFEVSIDMNGKKSEIKAMTKSSGSKCEVFLYGQKVHETRLANRLRVAAGWAAGREPNPSQAVDVRPSQRPSPGSGYTYYSGRGMTEGVLNALRPDASDAEFVGAKIGLSVDQSRKMIQLDSPHSLSATFELMGERDFLAFTPDMSDVYGPRYRVESIVTQSIPPRLRVRMKQNWMIGNAGADREAPMMIEAQLLTRPSADGLRSFQTQTLNVVPSEPYNENAAVACYQQRLNVLFDARGPATYGLQPSPDAVTYGCAGYVLDIDETVYQRAETRAAVAQFLTQMMPNRSSSSNGWDYLLIKWAARVQREGKPLRETLDPKGVRPSVYEAALVQADTLMAEAASFPNLSSYKENLVRVGYTWATRGENVPRQRLIQIFVGVDNIAAELPGLTLHLWNKLVSDPYGSNEELMYASGLNQQDKQNLVSVLKASSALELEAWSSANLGDLLRTRPSREMVAAWKAQLDAAAEFSVRDQARVKPGYEFMHKSRKRDLIAKAMSEGWTAETYAGADALARINALSPMCSNYSDTSSLAECRNEQAYSLKGLLNPVYSGRYVRLATQLDQKLSPLKSEPSASYLIGSISDEFFRVIWANCDAVGFESRANSLLTTVNSWARETDWFKKNEHERSIRDQLRQSCR